MFELIKEQEREEREDRCLPVVYLVALSGIGVRVLVAADDLVFILGLDSDKSFKTVSERGLAVGHLLAVLGGRLVH